MAACQKSSKNLKEFEESGAKICVYDGHTTPEKAKPFFNPRMKICRELILTTVGVLCAEKRSSLLTCLDAFGASGIAGLQWKIRYGDSCNVTVSEKDECCIENVRSNCVKNGLNPKPFPLDFARIAGLPLEPQQHGQISVKHCDVNVLMHMEAFDFIHLDPFGCPVKFLVAAFTNVRSNGVLCLVATDMGSLLGRYSNVALRNYGVHIMKTEYAQEVGARVLIAAAVRAGAQCNKGIEVLYSVSRDHFIVVGVRVKRGATSTDKSVGCIKNLFRCQICSERVFYPPSSHPIDAPYELLPCRCQTEKPGKTAVILGPMWCGELFNEEFVLSMYRTAVSENLSKTVITLLSTVVLEASCTNSTLIHSKLHTDIDHILRQSRSEKDGVEEKNSEIKKTADQNSTVSDEKVCSVDEVNGIKIKSSEESEGAKNSERLSKDVISQHQINPKSPTGRLFNENQEQTDSESINFQPTEVLKSHDKKRHLVPDHGDNDCFKKSKQENQSQEISLTNWPAFYYDLHKQNLPGLNLPKTSALVSLLQKAGYRASRTHFNTTGVRTSANMSQIREVMNRDSEQNQCKHESN